jgi:hypothetical protein
MTSPPDPRQIKQLARRCALLEGFAEGCAVGSGNEDWLETQLADPAFRTQYIEALHERIFELEQQLRVDQVEAAKRAVLFNA